MEEPEAAIEEKRQALRDMHDQMTAFTSPRTNKHFIRHKLVVQFGELLASAPLRKTKAISM